LLYWQYKITAIKSSDKRCLYWYQIDGVSPF